MFESAQGTPLLDQEGVMAFFQCIINQDFVEESEDKLRPVNRRG